MDNTKIVHAEQYDLACNWKMIADNVITLKRGFASAGRLFFSRVRSCTRTLSRREQRMMMSEARHCISGQEFAWRTVYSCIIIAKV